LSECRLTDMFHICSNAAMQPSPDTIRATVARRAAERAETLQSLSLLIGRNPAYLQQFIHRKSPRRLPEEERLRLAMVLDIDERELGARDPWTPAAVRS
jgi:hypothetical protein